MKQHPLPCKILIRSTHLLTLLILTIALAPVASLAQRGRVESGQITSDALTNNLLGDAATRPFRIYLPPSYDLSAARRFPVIYILHGYTQNESALVAGVQGSLDSLIRQRRIGEMIAVFVNGANRLNGSFYLRSPVIGDYETYITRDLVGLIDSRYRTLSSRESRGITGFSMGGWGAMHLALKFPAIFSVTVAESGLYDARGKQNDTMARQFATLHPTNLAQLGSVPFPANSIAAMFAGLAPNLQRPSLYADYPYERINGQLVLIDSVHQLALAGDVQHGDLARYLEQSIRLNGIRIVHGTSDSLIPVTEARQFTNALALAGLPFEYQEHGGSHVYLPELALPFLSMHLQGVELHVAPPRLNVTYAANTVGLSFPTQRGVEYWIESRSVLGSGRDAWDEEMRLTGDGQTANPSIAAATGVRFFRVRAANPLD